MVSMRAGYRSVFGVPQFRALWAAHVLSVAGDQLARVALTVLVFDRTRSAGLAAVTYALTYVPDLVGGAALSGLADRFPRRTVMVCADVARGVLIAAMALPGMTLPAQAALLAAVQLASAPFSAARQAVLPDVLEGADALAAGGGVLSMTYQAGLVIGFGGGGAVVAGLGTSGALWADAGTFAVSAAVIRFGLALHVPPGERAAGESRWAGIVAGWRVVVADARLRSLLALACCSGFYVVPEGLAVPYAAQLGGGPGAAGWLLAAGPAGMVAGMLLLMRVPQERRLRWLGPLATATSLVLLPTGWGPGLAASAVLWALSGAFAGHTMALQAAYVSTAPAEARGRAVGLAMAALRAAQGLAIVLAGLLAQVLAPAAVIALAAAAGVLAAAAGSTAWRRAASPAPGWRDEAGEDLAG
ncbi:MFS transporter [Amycolatopsis sp. NPDC004079]|uniref:MFS transporter n=1 Tax=Amycolatopsis sp. NPDC004079 TaxID=3154549 RepID=UPI0033B75999